MGEESEPTISVVGGEEVDLNIRCSNGSKFSVRLSLQLSVAEFKGVLAQSSNVPAEQQRLIYKGRILKDDQSLDSYGLQADHTIHMISGSAPPGPNPLSDTPKAGNSNSTLPAAHDVGSGEGGGVGLGASLFPGLGFNLPGGGGTSGLFGAGLPDFDQVERQLTQNPNIMREFMNVPAIQNIMSNPEWMRGLMMNNPQMREIIEQNPELGHMLNDPGILRQTLEAARNPEFMREMMRNTDRTMSNMESSPEGFNMLRQMYENVQEPFMNATTNGGGTGNDLGFNPFAALLGNQGGVNQSREGSKTTSTIGSETGSRTAAPNSNPLPNPWNSSGDAVRSNWARSNSIGDARTPSIVGSGGIGLLEMEGIFGMLDSSTLNQFMQSPAVTQMRQTLLSNPLYLDQPTTPQHVGF